MVVSTDPLGCVFEKGMSAEFLQFDGIKIGMVPGMDIQEVLVVFEQPVVFIGNVICEQGGGKFSMVVRAHQESDVMK